MRTLYLFHQKCIRGDSVTRNVLKIVTNQIMQNFHKNAVICVVTKMTNLNEYKCSIFTFWLWMALKIGFLNGANSQGCFYRYGYRWKILVSLVSLPRSNQQKTTLKTKLALVPKNSVLYHGSFHDEVLWDYIKLFLDFCISN